jgi:UPF0716 protein FxsA
VKAFWILLSLFVLVPVVEFAILLEVGQRLGTLWTLILVFGTGLVGAYLARMEGFRILQRMREDMHAGIVPADQIFNGVLVLIAGVVLLTPGLLTDLAGLALLFPPSRFALKYWLIRKFQKHLAARQIRITAPPRRV